MELPHPGGSGTVEKTLYVLVYHTDPVYTPDTFHQIMFLYAVDDAEASLLAGERLQARIHPCPAHILELKALPGGFKIAPSPYTRGAVELKGKLLYHADGTPKK